MKTKTPVICFWCAQPTGEFEELDFQADQVVLNYLMCPACHEKSDGMIKLVETETQPQSDGQMPIVVVNNTQIFPTGRWMTVPKDAELISQVFGKDAEDMLKYEQLLVNNETFEYALSTQEVRH